MITQDDKPTVLERKEARERFAIATRLENDYARSLRHLTRQIDHMVKSMAGRDNAKLQRMLKQYAELITPWAESIADKMLARIAKRDAASWIRLGREMGKELRKELDNAPTGRILAQLQREQVTLIQSLPLEAAERVHHLAQQALMTSDRPDVLTRKILETGQVTESRARLIARTETARVASNLTQARAEHVGSTHYVWRTVGDADVRESHKKMNGVVCRWDSPPEVEPGHRYHAGCWPNCRCFADVIFTD